MGMWLQNGNKFYLLASGQPFFWIGRRGSLLARAKNGLKKKKDSSFDFRFSALKKEDEIVPENSNKSL